MIGACPRCGTPRQGDLRVCLVCGLDFSTVPVSSACPRCNAPLYPGYPLCGNCGFDSRVAAGTAVPGQPPGPTPPFGFGYGQMPSQTLPPGHGYGYGYGQLRPQAYAPAPVTRQQPNNLGIALAILGAALLVVAGVLYVVAAPRSSGSSSPGTLGIALVSPTASPTESPTPLVTPSPEATESPSPAPPTAEPSPDGVWTKYSPPDGKWTVLFPGADPRPLKASQEIGTGLYKGNATVYAVTLPDGASGYLVMCVDFDASLFKGVDASAMLPLMAPSVAQGIGGSVVSTSASKVGAYSAEDETVSTSDGLYDLRMWFVGSRFWVLMAASTPGETIYPRYFMDSFKLK